MVSVRECKTIVRRDGTRVPFDPNKIFTAISKAGSATGEFGETEARKLAEQVVRVIANRHKRNVPTVEEIQDLVENVLIGADYLTTARSYIVYREQHRAMREGSQAFVDAVASINDYLGQQDWRVNANANQGYSLGGMILNTSGKLTANYWLSHVYPPEIGEAHRQGDYHIHDLDMLSGYCAGWSLRMFLQEGFNGVQGKVEAKAPKHLSSALGQMVNFLGTLQNEWAGAQAFSSFDTYLAPFVRRQHLSYREVHQQMQEFIYNLNVPSRWGTQTPFTNLTFDWVCPEDLRNQQPLVAGEVQDFTYGDLQPEMDMINRAFLEVMTAGDAKGRVFTFPIPTYNITPDFDWEHPNCDQLFELTAKYGLPYFQNFLNSDLKPSMVRSMCCRLQLDLRELLKRGNGLFGSGEQTGSIGVVTLNCARIGYEHKGNKEELFKKLDHLLGLAKRSLDLKRKTIQRHIDGGLFPYTRRYLGNLRNHFSTIGVNGLNECIRNFTDDRESIVSEWGTAFALEMLQHIRNRMTEFQQETGHLFNLEASPAEGATYRFAREDRKRYPDIIQAGSDDAPYYTNSSQLPVGYSDDPFEVLGQQEKLQQQYTGGTVIHLYMGERISTATACRRLVRKVLENFKVPYITVTPTFSICPSHGYLAGEHRFCPSCDEEKTVAIVRAQEARTGEAVARETVALAEDQRQRCEVWTRVMGYHRPVSQFNAGKKSEFAERKAFVENKVPAEHETVKKTARRAPTPKTQSEKEAAAEG